MNRSPDRAASAVFKPARSPLSSEPLRGEHHRILAYLGAPSRAVLTRAFSERIDVGFSSEKPEFVKALSLCAWQAIILESDYLTSDTVELLRRESASRELRLLVLAGRTTEAAVKVLSISAIAHTAVVFVDDPAISLVLRRKLHRPSESWTRARLLTAIAERLGKLPNHFRLSAIELFASSSILHEVDDLVQNTKSSRRTLDRWLDRVGIWGGRRLIVAVRAAYAWELARNEEAQSQARLAFAAGYSSVRAMHSQLGQIVGTTYEEFLQMRDEAAFVEALTAWLLDSPA